MGALEALDRFGQELLGQPEHDIGEEDTNGDGREEHQIQRRRGFYMAVVKRTSQNFLTIISNGPQAVWRQVTF